MDGGAVYNDNGEATFANCTIAGNHAGKTPVTGWGGGIYSTESADTTLVNCILWDNVASQGSVPQQQITGPATVTYSCVEGDYPGEGNIDLDPRLWSDRDWGHLDDNARLMRDSPCIDQGNPDDSLVPADEFDIDHDDDTDEKLDLDLNPRIVDRDDVLGAIVDMGAYEFHCVGDVDGSGVVDISDFLVLLAAWGPCPDPPDRCPADIDGNGTVNVVDFLALLADWGCPDPDPESFPESAQQCIDRYWPNIEKVAACITALELIE